VAALHGVLILELFERIRKLENRVREIEEHFERNDISEELEKELGEILLENKGEDW